MGIYSGYKIYPCHGRSLIKVDGKTYKFLSSRTLKAHLLKRNPREVTWTVLYRRKHKKGQQEEEQEDSEVPEGCCWRHPSGYHGQEEPEARGQEGSEGAGRESCQGRQEADRFQEGPVWRQEGTEGSEGCCQECPEVRPQGWRKEINRHLLARTSCMN